MLKARTKLACRIAGLDSLRLNEAVHAGRYPCAPPTRAGASRVFDIDDIVALCVYRHLTEEISTEHAGYFTAQILNEFRDKPGVSTVYRITGANRASFWTADAPKPDAVYGVGKPIAWMGFNIKALREMVIAELEEEDQIKGED